MQEFTKEFKTIRDTTISCRSERSAKKNALDKAIELRKRAFGDMALNQVSSIEKKAYNKSIKQMREDIEDLDIVIEELTLRQALIKREGRHMKWIDE